MSKLEFDYRNLDKLADKIEKLGSDNIRKVVERSLEEQQKDIASKIRPLTPVRTRDLKEHIIDHKPVEWSGTVAKIDIGYEFPSGLKGVYLMNGTKVHGTPRVKPHKKLHDAVFGPQVKKDLTRRCEEIIEEMTR